MSLVVGLHHVQLAMPRGREAEARAFYVGTLGLEEVEKPIHLMARGGCWFRSDHVQVHLGVEEDFRPARKAHPALVVSDLVAVRRRLEDRGVEVRADDPLPGFDRVYAQDPFGNRIELLTPAETLAPHRRPRVGEVVFSRVALRKTIPIALLVGTVLSLINQAAVILGGQATAMTWVRVGLNYVVPFIVSSAGFVAGELAAWKAEHGGGEGSPSAL